MSRDTVRLLHIRDAIQKIRSYASNRGDLDDPMVQDAVIRNLEVIGEAVKMLSDEVRTAQPDIPWASIAGMRDRLVHHYFSVDLDLVWDVVTSHLGKLEEAVETVLANRDSTV